MPLATDDFRVPAIEASEKTLRALGPSALSSPTEAGISYCLSATANAEALIRRFKTVLLVGVIGGILLALGAATLFILSFVIAEFPLLLRCGAGILIAIAFACILLPLALEPAMARNFLRRNLGDLWSTGGPEPFFTSLENAHTYSQFKVLAEDIAFLICHPDAQCIEIEGLRCRYMIYAQDVREITLHRNGRATLLSYTCCGVQLDLAIIPRGVVGSNQDPSAFGKAAFGRMQAALVLSPSHRDA